MELSCYSISKRRKVSYNTQASLKSGRNQAHTGMLICSPLPAHGVQQYQGHVHGSQVLLLSSLHNVHKASRCNSYSSFECFRHMRKISEQVHCSKVQIKRAICSLQHKVSKSQACMTTSSSTASTIFSSLHSTALIWKQVSCLLPTF